jgi:Amt family ammonium transporter
MALGISILWFGWYGFNCGSTLTLVGPNVEVAAHIAMNTSIGAGVGGMSALLVRFLIVYFGKEKKRYYDVPATVNGILAGLVATTVSVFE